MDDLDPIVAYARALEEALARAGRPTQPLVDEAIAHLVEDAARIARAEGCSEAEAARRAIARFGDVPAVVTAVRKNGRALAASIARITSLLVFVVAAWNIFTTFLDPWPMRLEDALIINFLAELGFTAIIIDRALAGGRSAARLMPPILVLNGLLAAALLIGSYASDVVQQHIGNGRANYLAIVFWQEPLWALMLVQSLAGLRALGGSRARDGALVAG